VYQRGEGHAPVLRRGRVVRAAGGTYTGAVRTIVFLLALTATAPPTPAPVPAPDVSRPSDRIGAVAEEAWDAYLELHPRLATRLGDDRFADRFGDGLSPRWRGRMERLARRTIEEARAVDPAELPTDEHRLTRRLLVEWMTTELESLAFPEHLLVVNHLPSSPPVAFARELRGAGPARFRRAADYDAFLARMSGFVPWVEEAVAGLEEGAAHGVVAPCPVVEATLEQLDRVLQDGVAAGAFMAPVSGFPAGVGADDRRRIATAWGEAVAGEVVPAYRTLRRAVAEVSLPACRPTLSMRSLPGGGDWYRMRVRRFTTVSASPVSLFQLGLEECRRLRRELDRLEARRERRPGSLDGGVLRGPREVLGRFGDIRRRVESRLPVAFGHLPETELRIVPMDGVVAASGARAVYQAPVPGSGRPGVFLVDLSDGVPERGIEALFLHEALPGHHLQLSLAAENGDLPAFRRHLYQGAFMEGWALYAEGLGDLLGLYADPVQQAGRLEEQLRRAARLVADVGIHGLGWDRSRLEEVLRDVAGGVNLDEIDRYAAMPGQGLTYTVGERTFTRLRERAHDELGGAFDLRAFHDEVLRHGALPLPVLAEVVERWVDLRRPGRRQPPDGVQ